MRTLGLPSLGFDSLRSLCPFNTLTYVSSGPAQKPRCLKWPAPSVTLHLITLFICFRTLIASEISSTYWLTDCLVPLMRM